ncbi:MULTISPECIES: transglycosylase SLT domain-containing protein [unclassified Mesorhizobium]|uniref:lytic transglycosylase domain-containing protein n=1 Tax=unclassified Mesorhizobium TaxID=325217 RepID=UPI00112C4C34|nr:MULTISPECIES: transglycosylase SLT domain-containing protein [unclassified Mesorhizobium]TPJ47780.1 lytic transglycosylase domain-containing protein [Mesorhizobium sp. B2-6-6]MCA0001246.1 transglycosylase SLT domain-containing protein [Mesorhizobium sp. B264B2A]MCA0004275.1 transglycosylase SLT domain-containing protein [Mesorhizobium sp. B264B1B]MCA0018499.1 transglycosylase SLT domain-containing protein [Mesorhizobium sp. B264B1A]TPM06909.1 lytic transglycosylase domain-containing protein
MQKLTVVTAALAAGVMTFAFGAASAAPLSPRADQGLVAATAKGKAISAKSSKDVRAAKRSSAKVEKASWTKAKKPSTKQKTRRGRKAVDKTTTASIGIKDAAASTAAVASGDQYSAIVARYAASYGVPASLAHAVIKIESNYRPNLVGGAGEIGLMQIKPATARMMGYSGSANGLFNPDTNIKYGMKYLAMARDLGGGTTCGTILKYNAGHGATRMNPVSAAYCSKVKVQLAAVGSPA